MADIRKGSVIQNSRRRVAHIQKDAEERAVLLVIFDQTAQRLGIFEGSEWAVNRANDFAEGNFGWRPRQAVSALGAADALDDARVFELKQNELEEFFGQL